MTRRISWCAAAALAMAASFTAAQADDTDAHGKTLLAAAKECYATYAKSMMDADEDSEIPQIVNTLQNYLCLKPTQAASQYVRNADLVERYAARIKDRFNRDISVDPESGALLTDLQYNDAASTGWQDLLNAVSISSDPYGIYVNPLASLTQAAGRTVLEAMLADE